jgi:hypothetical protein
MKKIKDHKYRKYRFIFLDPKIYSNIWWDLCPPEECGPSRPLQLTGVKYEDV